MSGALGDMVAAGETGIVAAEGKDLYRQSTDAAGLCRAIVIKTSQKIGPKQYVRVEGWQAIATAHGCIAGSGQVQKVEGGIRAEGYVRRMHDGLILATAEGFVGEDEPTWYGGTDRYGKQLPKRAEYAIRAMAQTRAISRACRSAFAHVVVLMDAGLSTTPAEEVPDGGFDDDKAHRKTEPAADAMTAFGRREISTGTYSGRKIGSLSLDEVMAWEQELPEGSDKRKAVSDYAAWLASR